MLVALAVDAWQRERDDTEQLQGYLASFVREIDQNLFSINIIKDDVVPTKLARLERVIAVLESGDEAALQSESLLSDMTLSTSNAELWLTRSSYDSVINAGGFKQLDDRELEAWISGIFTGPGVLLKQTTPLRCDYPALVSGLVPVDMMAAYNPLAGYFRNSDEAEDPNTLSPTVTEPSSRLGTAQRILASRDDLLLAARAEVSYATAVWYALARMESDFTHLRRRIVDHPLLQEVDTSNLFDSVVEDAD